MSADVVPQSPYVGLIPYSASDAHFFFGRETETEIISANLRSARLTVLYGASGVGKSSVLQAGVVHNLRELARQDTKTYGQAEFAVVSYRKWAGEPLEGIAEAAREAVAESLGIESKMLEPVPEKKDLTKILQAWAQRYGLEMLVILDQFEELFNYAAGKKSPCAAFAAQLSKAVNTSDLPARFLLSLRGDTLSMLDYFKGDIPGLFDNRLQIHPLAESDARRAITEPIKAYNNLYKPVAEFSIEPLLVDEIIEQVKIGRGESSTVAAPRAAASGETVAAKLPTVKNAEQAYVETPYLQLVMKRIWREEVQVGSNVLRLETLAKKLGGAAEVIQTHLDDVMNTLNDKEKQIAARCFKYLVTPMGTKLALTPAALVKYIGSEEEEIRIVLELLIKGKESGSAGNLDISVPVLQQKAAIDGQQREEPRILRTVEIPVGKERIQGYEVTHDALIPAIQDWRARYVIEHRVNQMKTIARRVLPVAAGIIILIFLFLGWRWKVNREYAELYQSEATALQGNYNVENQLTQISQYKEKQALEEANDDKNTNYKALIPILINLSENSSAAQKDIAIKNLKLLVQDGKVPKEYEGSIIKLVAGIDAQKAADLQAAVVTANSQSQSSNQQISPRVYIHITDEQQRAAAQRYQNLLADNKFLVPAIEYVSGIKLSGTQIRYFRQNDETLALQIVQLLKTGEIENIRTQYIPGYEDSTAIRPKHLELWFATDAFVAGNNSLK